MTDCDVAVVGGGPVGLVAAIHAARAGLQVQVVEPRHEPIDKACGEGLMPSALEALHSIGVTPDGQPFRGIQYVDASTDVVATAYFRGPPGRGVRRTVLHEQLYRRAKELGVEQRVGKLTDLCNRDGFVELAVDGRERLSASHVLAADGLHSECRRLLGLEVPSTRPPRFGLRRHYSITPWSEYVEVYWASAGEAYVTPVAPDLVGVALLGKRGSGSFEQRLSAFPALAMRLQSASPVGGVMGAGPFHQRAVRKVSGRVLLVGDASGYVDALTGEGLAVGFTMAAAAVAAIADGQVQQYQRNWSAMTRRQRWATTSLVTISGHPPVRRRIVPAAARLPAAFTFAVNRLA